MPKRDPGTPERADLYADAVLYVENGKWQMKINLPKGNKPRQPVRTTGVPYVPNNPSSEGQALIAADRIYKEIKAKVASGQPLTITPLYKMAESYRKECCTAWEGNKEAKDKGFQPKNKIEEGRGLWTIAEWRKTKVSIDEYIIPFWKQPKYKKLHIAEINFKHIQEWIDWKEKAYGDERAPSTIRKHHTVMRHCFKWARRNGYINAIPHIPDPPQELAKRRRPDMSDVQWEEFKEYQMAKYSAQGKENGEYTQAEAYAWQFMMYLLMLEHTGIRPFNSIEKAPQWRHIKREGDKTLVWRDEKGKGRWAKADPYFNNVLIRLEKWQRGLGVFDPGEGYLFVHPKTVIDWQGTILREKGKPINNFAKAWQVAMADLGWNEGKTKQSERITQYSIRHRYATKRLYDNKEMSIYELAVQLGNSISMIETIYAHANATRDWDTFMAQTMDETYRIDFFWKHSGVHYAAIIPGSPEYEEAINNKRLIREERR